LNLAPSNKRFTKARGYLGTIVDLAAILLLLAVVGRFLSAFAGFPKGFDAFGHISQIRILMRYFPHINWNHLWYSGLPVLQHSYPPLFYLLGAALAAILPISIPSTILLLSALSHFVILACAYGVVRMFTGSRLSGLFAAALTISSPAFWAYIIYDGHYPRVLATMFLALVAYLGLAYFKAPEARGARLYWVGMVISVAASMSTHPIGALTLLLIMPMAITFPDSLVDKVKAVVGVVVSVAFLSAYFYLPSYTLGPGAGTPLTDQYQPLPLANLFFSGRVYESLPAIMVPLTAILLFILIWRHVTGHRATSLKVLVPFFSLSVLLIFYGLIGHWAEFDLYIRGFAPAHTLYYISIFTALLDGLVLGMVSKGLGGRVKKFLSALLAFTVAFTLLMIPSTQKGIVDLDTELKHEIQRILPLKPEERGFRVGVAWDGGSDWINAKYDIPQTRGYLAQSVLYPGWQFWLEYAVWSQEDNYQETDFLFDWYAVRGFYSTPLTDSANKFLQAQDSYARLGHTEYGDIYSFAYEGSSPILSATVAPNLLHLGSGGGYELLLHGLAYSNFNSQDLIPLRGPEFIDESTLEELSQFGAIILYDYQYHDQQQAFTLLGDYVRNGGGLIIETNNSPDTAAFSLPDSVPAMSTKATDYGTDWNLSSVEHEMVEGIDLSSFGPAIYAGGPWGVSSVAEESIRDWASPVLWINGHPIVVAGQYGQGRVVWTGMNLLYHITSYQSAEESRFLAQMIQWVSSEDEVAQPHYEARFMHPQRREVIVQSPAQGLLFKESYFPNWHAYVAGRERRIYRAGPDFMYVPLSEEISYPLEVILLYEKAWLERISIGISLLTLGGLIFYALEGWVVPPLPRRFRRLLPQWPAMALKAARDWWADEE
jgi:hypothetical protein